MALLGSAAMALLFDIAPEAIAEHDDWHTHEHLPERLAIPGFLRGTRWTALSGSPRYFVLYEVADIGVLSSPAYLERLNNPTPWTTKIMPHYRGMRRSLCRLTSNLGANLGTAALLVQGAWTSRTQPDLPATPGLSSAHVLEAAAAAQMTREQSIRGRDAAVDRVTLVTGYSTDVLAQHLEAVRAGGENAAGLYRMDCLHLAAGY